MKFLSTLFLLLALNTFSQGYTATNDPYKGHVTLSEKSDKHIIEFIDSILDKNPHRNSGVFGELKVIFKLDSVSRVYDLEILNSVDPYYDSLVINSFYEMPENYFDHLKKHQFYGIYVQLGKDKYYNKFMNGWMLLADNKTIKSEKIFSKLLTKAPNNSRVMFSLGKSMLKNGKKKGLEYIEKAAEKGDVKALKYLEKNEP